LYAVDEFIDLRDTPDMIKAIKNRYPEHNVIVYPDASGKATSSKSSTQSDHRLLKQAGFKIKARKTNPFVRERVMSVNVAFEKGKTAVNIETCPQFTEALEQQTYNKEGTPDKKVGHDHPNDAWGYLVNWLFALKRPKLSTVRVRTI